MEGPTKRKIGQPSKIVVDSQSVIGAVDDVMRHYLEQGLVSDCFTGHQNEAALFMDAEAFMQSEKLTLGEMNIELWDVALNSALVEISRRSYPHTATVKALINCLLNNYGETDFGTITEILDRLLEFHPPYTDTLRSYYKKLIHDHYAQVNKKGVEKEPFFWVLLDLIENLPENVGKRGLVGWELRCDEEPDDIDTSFNSGGNLKDKLRDLVHKKTVVYVACKSYYESLSPAKQYLRSSLCFKFICDLLERDHLWRLNALGNKRKHVKCLLSDLIWPDIRYTGQLTQNLNKIVNLLFKKMPDESADLNRLLSMIAQLVNFADRLQENEYPFLGTYSKDLARAVSLLLLERVKAAEDEFLLINHLTSIKPGWFRLLCCSHVLGTIAGFHCPPELLSVTTVLEHILQIVKGQKKVDKSQRTSRLSADPILVAKYEKLKSVNIKYRSGATRMHMACRQDKPDAVRALLTFTQLDLNQTDADGWTALHDAASKGSTACVEELLSYSPRLGSVQRPVDTRARGPQNYTPLMLAVQNGHKEICSILLQHTGSVLLEDITDDNETALELCDNEGIRSVLTHYKKNRVETIHSRKRLHLTTNNLCLVVRLCSVFVQSYLSTHRTWDVYHKMKAPGGERKRFPKINVLFQYSRYHRDLKTNIPRLRLLSTKLQKNDEIVAAADELHCFLSLNKS